MTVSYGEEDGVAWLLLDRPEAINALNRTMHAELLAALQRAEESSAIRVIAVTGAGDRGFCAGADVKEFKPETSLAAAERRIREPTWSEFISRVLSKPLVSGIHGYCLGGGLELALASDIRIASNDVKLGLPEVTRAVIPGAGGTQRLQRVVGVGMASYLILTGTIISASEALACGLVSKVVPREDLVAAVEECVHKIRAAAPTAVRYARASIRYGQEVPLSAGLAMERRLSELLTFSADRSEAGEAFTQKRSAHFSEG